MFFSFLAFCRLSICFLAQVGMRHFHVLRNREHCPIVNLDKLWSMLPAGTLEEAKAAGGKAPVIDVTDSVSLWKKERTTQKEEKCSLPMQRISQKAGVAF